MRSPLHRKSRRLPKARYLQLRTQGIFGFTILTLIDSVSQDALFRSARRAAASRAAARAESTRARALKRPRSQLNPRTGDGDQRGHPHVRCAAQQPSRSCARSPAPPAFPKADRESGPTPAHAPPAERSNGGGGDAHGAAPGPPEGRAQGVSRRARRDAPALGRCSRLLAAVQVACPMPGCAHIFCEHAPW